HREQLKLFKEALILPLSFTAGPFVPQKMYMPNTNSDRRRYVEEIDLQRPIYFWMESPDECGISLIDALHSRVRRLRQRDEPVFEGRGPSISVRIQWPGYRPWSRQIPTKDFRSPPQPITKAKLAKNIAKCVERFLSARTGTPLEDDVDPRWKVGLRNHEIKLEDLYLASSSPSSVSWTLSFSLNFISFSVMKISFLRPSFKVGLFFAIPNDYQRPFCYVHVVISSQFVSIAL
ncbi:hypothetical protein J132_04582, partial [Termitomyces sp. J132]